MKNILTSISLEKSVQSSLQLDAEKSRKKGRPKLTIETVKQHIESFEGYQLISTTYENNSTKLDILCPQNHHYKVVYSNFQQGNRCPECASNAKHRLSNVKAYIESFGYRLRSTTYENNSTKLDILCPVGHTFKMPYEIFKAGTRCRECSGRKEQKRQTEPKGYNQIRERYKRQEEQKELKRQSKHTLEKSVQASLQLDAEKSKKRERHSNTKFTIEAVKQHIESFEGYQLISIEYVNSYEKLDIICPMGHLFKCPYHNFQKGIRCRECARIKQGIARRRTMINGEDWEPYGRNSKADKFWAIAVKKRDGQICQVCHSSKNLCAHHIESYGKNPELRDDISNGVTLCKSCHTAIHSRYGVMTATRQDLEEFTRLKCR